MRLFISNVFSVHKSQCCADCNLPEVMSKSMLNNVYSFESSVCTGDLRVSIVFQVVVITCEAQWRTDKE